MDEETEQLIQSLAAKAAAHGFVIEFLLRAELGRLPIADREAVAEWLRHASTQTQAFHGRSKDDFHAARIADLLIDMQGEIGGMIDRALLAVSEAEGRN